jgi:hypothetical protein
MGSEKASRGKREASEEARASPAAFWQSLYRGTVQLDVSEFL